MPNDILTGVGNYASPNADTYDLLTLDEGKTAINVDTTDSTYDFELSQVITAVSQRIVDLCGPVVNKTFTNETYDGGDTTVRDHIQHHQSARRIPDDGCVGCAWCVLGDVDGIGECSSHRGVRMTRFLDESTPLRRVVVGTKVT